MQKVSQILKWFEKEKFKDDLEIKSSKNRLIEEIKGINKNDLFSEKTTKEKSNLWWRIRKVIWGS